MKFSTLIETVRYGSDLRWFDISKNSIVKNIQKGGKMTTNQINFWKLMEDRRSHLEQEKEQRRSNIERERETRRSNMTNEQLSKERNSIQQQANVINKQNFSESLEETKRANLVKEKQASDQLAYSYYNADTALKVAQTNAGVGYANVNLGYANLAEQSRANIAREDIQTQSNVVNMFNAQTSRFKQNLEEQKWDTVGYWSETAKTNWYSQQIAASKTSQSKMEAEISNMPVNSWANVLGAVGRTITPLIRRGK